MDNCMNNFVKGLQHIGIPTNSMDETIAFYKAIGFTVIYETVNEAANEKVAFFKQGNLVIEAYENKQAVMASGAVDHIALDVTDVEQVYQIVQKEGFPIVSDGIQFLPFWENGVKFFIITGPNKERIEFNQYL